MIKLYVRDSDIDILSRFANISEKAVKQRLIDMINETIRVYGGNIKVQNLDEVNARNGFDYVNPPYSRILSFKVKDRKCGLKTRFAMFYEDDDRTVLSVKVGLPRSKYPSPITDREIFKDFAAEEMDRMLTK